MTDYSLGPVVLFGSGETSRSGGQVFEEIARRLDDRPRIAILETPAGFQPNSAKVAGQIADFLEQRLQNYSPVITVVPARKRNTVHSPDDADLVRPLLTSDLLFLGPGSPTYAARQLQHSRAWHFLSARHRLGAAVVFASAATVAAGARTLPVYEIFKAGHELHWEPGLDFFAPFGLSLIFIPHWNNNEGGDDFDSSRCYMGVERFRKLLTLLPGDSTIVGIDEHTALILDLDVQECQVMGTGGVTLLTTDAEQRFERDDHFPLDALGECQLPAADTGIPDNVWDAALSAREERQAEPQPSQEVLTLVEERQEARKQRDWETADELRDRIADMGWQVQDTPEGPTLEPA